MNSSK